MKLIDRIIFSAIAVFLGILAVRSLQVVPVEATREEIIKVEIVGIRSFLELPVSLKTIGDRNISWRGWQERGLTD